MQRHNEETLEQIRIDFVQGIQTDNERKYPTIDEGKYKGCIGVGGLVLARIPIQKIKRLGT